MRRTVLILSSLSALAIGVMACSDEQLATQPSAPIEPGAPALAASPSLAPTDANATFFGPETFTRGRGKPTAESREISIAGYGSPYTLHLQNGDAGGGARVSSARVVLNGKSLFGPSDFSKDATGYTRTVELTDPSEITVELASAPGSQLSIWIEGARLPASVAVTPGEVALASIGATEALAASVLDVAGLAIAGATVDWVSTNPDAVVVDEQGVVTAVANGAATITATSGAVSGSAEVTVAQVASTVEVAPSEVTLTSAGATSDLAATVRDAGGAAMAGAPVTWTSSDEAVATVTAGGVVTAIGGGSASIAATSGEASDTVIVTVAQIAAKLEVAPGEVTLTSLNATAQLTATVRDARGAEIPGSTINWSSSAPAVATVNGQGLVTAQGTGSAVITASSGSVAGTAKITVGVIPAKVEVVPGSLTLTSLGDMGTLAASVFDGSGAEIADAAVEWSSSNASIVSVDQSGKVTEHAVGEVTITAKSGTAAGTATVKALQVAELIVMNPTSADMAPGDQLQFSTTVYDEGNSIIPDPQLFWSSTNPGIATVTSTGFVTAIAAGNVTIHVGSGPASGNAFVTVGQSQGKVVVTPGSATLGAGHQQQLTATVLDSKNQPIPGAVVSWTTSNAGVALVTGTGKVGAEGPGTATITASSPGAISGTAQLTITASFSGASVSSASSMSQATLQINSPIATQFPATIVNPTGSTISSVAVQTRIVQGSFFADSGVRAVSCGVAAGELPAATCTTTATVHAGNGFAPGGAVMQIYLVRLGSGDQTSPILTVPITLQ